ncbi:DUF927 domain-containing protein [Nitrosomonas sp.]|uniref:DUF927 domain-containing protein n=1 Tax=Nitrosomonas sp. TaxID=42353 RepID=UPI001D4809C9|nr:DUF927 domain-containing protein [Nitrosomonas sp.]MBX3616834.1 DUF927 domain-containing protein [Nitrosomonas sp.]
MPTIPYIKRVAAAALGSIDSVLNHWLPSGKREGHEYLPLNPKRSDSAPGSFSINLHTGAWSDFATGDKGLDLVSLVAYLENETQGKAANRLAVFLGIEAEASNPQKRATNGSIKPGNGKPSANRQESNAVPVSPGGDDEKGNKYEWRFKVPPGLRPLFGLPGLLQFHDATCWFTEGEKAAEALQKLLPDHPVLCWQGGSQAVEKSDYASLAGRDCVIFPDYDLPGKKAANDLMKRLTAAGARSVRVLDVDRLERGAGEQLRPGDDAADLVACGWDAARFGDFIKREDAFLPNANPGAGQSKPADKPDEPQAEAVQRGFELFDDGLYFLEPTKDGRLRRRKVCARLEVLALARDTDSREWGTLVRFADPDNKVKQLVIPARSFNGDGLEASGRLLSEGLTIAPKARQLVIEYLQTQNPEKRASTTNRTGWHGIGDDLVFVLPDGSIGHSGDEWLFSDSKPDSSLFRQRGTLKQWREHVAALCVGNSRLTFAVSVAFAAPLLHLIEMESGGFHLRGTTSSGKTSALTVAGSVCGSPEYLQRWRSTDNGLESTALSHCDALLTLDELKMIDARIAGESAYMLANGAAKVRANVSGGARNTAKWRLLFLSAGELSLAQHVAEAGKKTPAGAELRMADIPADAGQGLGCFENLHGFENGHEFSKALNAAVNKHYGTAFPAFIEHVLKHRETLRESLFNARQKFEKATLTQAASGQAQRVAARFALAGAAGELATDWDITGWLPGEAMQAAITCFKAWLQAFGGEGNKEERAMIEQVRHFLELHGEARFTDSDRANADDSHAPKTLNRAGFREKNHEGELEFFCLPEVFKTEICKGFDSRSVARLLIDRGCMKPGDGRNLATKKRLPGCGMQRVFHILPTIWGSPND